MSDITKMYYVFCSTEEETEINSRGIDYLYDENCGITPTLLVVDLPDMSSVAEAVYTASTHGGYLLVTAKEFGRIKATHSGSTRSADMNIQNITKEPARSYVTVCSTSGTLRADTQSGDVLAGSATSPKLEDIANIRIETWRADYGVHELPAELDILDIGYRTAQGIYTVADSSWRIDRDINCISDDLFVLVEAHRLTVQQAQLYAKLATSLAQAGSRSSWLTLYTLRQGLAAMLADRRTVCDS